MAQLTAAEIETRSGLLIASLCLVYFTAPNDRNGNPRRLWALFTPAGQLCATYDEGYEGSHALPAMLRPKAATAYAVPIAAATYNAMLRHGRSLMEI